MRRVLGIGGTLLLTLLLAAAPSGFSQQSNSALMAMVETERAFARASVEKGMRESFLGFFAEDGINFQPGPTRFREAALKRPAPATRPPTVLNWEPIYAGVSLAGDLGFSTGPYTVTDHSQQDQIVAQGHFFSVWKKQADGNWRVAVDIGIETESPEPLSPAAFRAAPVVQPKKPAEKLDREAALAGLMNVEREFQTAAQKGGFVQAFLSRLADDARLHRHGSPPFVGKAAIRSFYAGKSATVSWEPIAGDVAASGDLGYDYGRYEVAPANVQSGGPQKGYYLRVWRRNAEGAWQIVADITNPLPAPEDKE